jgi:hypothetical protein
MTPIKLQVVDCVGSGKKGLRATLHCLDSSLQPIVEFDSITDDDGEISRWFPRNSVTEAGRLEPRLLDTSLLGRVALSLESGLHPTYMALRREPLLHLSDRLPGVIIQLAPVLWIHYVAPHPLDDAVDLVRGGVNQGSSESPISPLQLPSPVTGPRTGAAGIKRKRRAIEDHTGVHAAKKPKAS